MEKQDDPQKKQWSLFQAFCCGPKAAKKRQPNNNSNSQPESNIQSAREANGCTSMQRNSHNNQTGIAMRPTAVNEDNNNINNNYDNNEQDDDNESLSSSNKLHIHQQQQKQQQLQRQQLRLQLQQQQQYQQQSYSMQQYPQSNHVIKINSHQNQHHHHRQASQQYEQSNLQQLQQLQQIQQVNSSQQQQPSHSQYQSLHRRAYSVNQSSSLSQQVNEIIQEVQQSQVSSSSSYQSQRVDTQQSNHSGNSSRRQQQQQQPYYTMTNQFFSLKTKYAIHEIDFVETRPTDKEFQSYFTFDCPICFRHFNKILKSDCCDHYLCHYCLRDIYNKAKDSTDNFKFRCMFCQIPVPLYVDADCAADKIKRYSDSPFITPKEQQTAGGVENTVQPFNIHQNSNLIEFAEDNSSIDKENVYNSHHNGQHFVNAACSVSHTINKPPLPHLAVNSKIQSEQNPGILPRRDKNLSFQENENVNQSAHKPAGLIPEFQNKYHCNYLQNNGNQGNNQQQKATGAAGSSSQQSSQSSISINQSTSIKLIR